MGNLRLHHPPSPMSMIFQNSVSLFLLLILSEFLYFFHPRLFFLSKILFMETYNKSPIPLVSSWTMLTFLTILKKFPPLSHPICAKLQQGLRTFPSTLPSSSVLLNNQKHALLHCCVVSFLTVYRWTHASSSHVLS